MPRFAANVSMRLNEVPFLDRFSAAANAGFCAVGFPFPVRISPDEIAKRLREAKLENVLFNLPPGKTKAGERGLACLGGREAELRLSVNAAIPYPSIYERPALHVIGCRPLRRGPGSLPRDLCAETPLCGREAR